MAETEILKIIAQGRPVAATPTILYTSPAQSRVQIKSVFVCNLGAAATFDLAVVPVGSGISGLHHIFYQQVLTAPGSFSSDIPIYVNNGDYVWVLASTNDVAFTLFGNEN